jgi:hypothetical protein
MPTQLIGANESLYPTLKMKAKESKNELSDRINTNA